MAGFEREPEAVPGAAEHAAAPGVGQAPGGLGWVLQMHRSAGNQAVGRMLARQVRGAAAAPIPTGEQIDQEIAQAEAAARSADPESSFPLFGIAYEHVQQLLRERTETQVGLMD